MAAGCQEGKCWAGPGQFCKTPSGTRRRPHPGRVADAGRAGLLGGAGRAWLQEQALGRDDGATVTVGQTVMVLPPLEVADAG